MRNTTALLMALGLALPAMTFSQDSDQTPPARRERPAQTDGGPNGERRPVPPLMAALDANHDGVIDADEIKNASAALLKLDKNGDGKLTMDELRPQRPDGPRADGRDDRGPDNRPEGGPQRRAPRAPEAQ